VQIEQLTVGQTAEDIPTPSINEVETVLSDMANLPKPPSWARTRNVREQFQHAFELIGGIPRLAHWAHANPTEFFKLYARMIPTAVTGENGGAIKVELSWINGRDTSGRSPPSIIDVEPLK
jgi:hypothetical protein